MRINSSIDKRVEIVVFSKIEIKHFFQYVQTRKTNSVCRERKIVWDYDDEYFDYIYILMYVSNKKKLMACYSLGDKKIFDEW